jgi:hypothetical protein
MEVHMKRRPFVTSALAASLIALFSSALAWAGISPQPFRTGLFGIVAGQAIRVSVLNAGIERGVINPCVNPAPLAAKVAIRGLDGATLFESLIDKLHAGTGGFADFAPLTPSPVARPAVPSNRRLQVRAEVSFTEEDMLRVQACGVALTLEVFDLASGRTEVTLPFAAVMFNPQPEPPEPVAVP